VSDDHFNPYFFALSHAHLLFNAAVAVEAST